MRRRSIVPSIQRSGGVASRRVAGRPRTSPSASSRRRVRSATHGDTAPGVPLGVGHEARHRARLPRRRRGGDDRPRRRGRPARLDVPPPARPRLRAPARGREPDRAGRASGASTPTTGSTCSARRSRSTRAWPFATYLAGAVLRPLGLGRPLRRPPRLRPLRLPRRPARARPRAARADAGLAGDDGRGDDRPVPGPGRRPAGLRPPGAERLGPRLRAPRPRSRRTGPAAATRRGRSATSAEAARSSGSTRRPGSPSAA